MKDSNFSDVQWSLDEYSTRFHLEFYDVKTPPMAKEYILMENYSKWMFVLIHVVDVNICDGESADCTQ